MAMSGNKILAVIFSALLWSACSLSSAADMNEGLRAYLSGDYATALPVFRKYAEQGDDLAQGFLGDMYYKGQGVPQDYTEALKWYRKAAEQGNSLAQIGLGRMYSNGQGVPQSDIESDKWIHKAAEQLTAVGLYAIGKMYYEGLGVSQDYIKAAKWFRKSAEQGHAGAQGSLGLMYRDGIGVSQDYTEAAKWMHKSAEQGNARAQALLGDMHRDGQGVPQDYAEAVKWFRKSAEQGHAGAQGILGFMYDEGQGVPQDYTEAAKWFRKAAEQGDAIAQFNLGIMYSEGQGIPQDHTEAANWYRKAAEQGYASAQFNLGFMYLYSDDQSIPQDYTEAAKWFRKAAEQGNTNAQGALGVMYSLGQGVPENDAEAYIWFSLATAGGFKDPQELRTEASRRLSSAALESAQQEASRRWQEIQDRKTAKITTPALPSQAPRNSKITRRGTSLLFSGDIQIGDARSLQNHIANGRIKAIAFDSNGGNVMEGMAIGKLIRENLIHTQVPPDAECHSACVIAFIGGVERQPYGPLGIHSVYSEDFIGSGDFAGASDIYNQISTELTAYLEAMRIPVALLDHMKRVPHDKIDILNTDEIQAYFLRGVDPVYRQTHQTR